MVDIDIEHYEQVLLHTLETSSNVRRLVAKLLTSLMLTCLFLGDLKDSETEEKPVIKDLFDV